MAGTAAWRQRREHLNRSVEALRQQGICATCHDLATGKPYGHQHVIYDDDLFKVTLEPYPRTPGHTIVIFKPHRSDFAELSEEEAGRVFQLCVSVANAIKRGLGAVCGAAAGERQRGGDRPPHSVGVGIEHWRRRMALAVLTAARGAAASAPGGGDCR